MAAFLKNPSTAESWLLELRAPTESASFNPDTISLFVSSGPCV